MRWLVLGALLVRLASGDDDGYGDDDGSACSDEIPGIDGSALPADCCARLASDWFAHCNPVDGVVVLPSAAGLEAREISRAAGKRKRHHVERPRGRSCGSRRRRRCSATGGRCTSSYG